MSETVLSLSRAKIATQHLIKGCWQHLNQNEYISTLNTINAKIQTIVNK